jgi:hypothetical protein
MLVQFEDSDHRLYRSHGTLALLNLVKPLQPRVFDVYTPEQFRKALSGMFNEISRL